MDEVKQGAICIPGDRLGDSDQLKGGYGTYERQGYVCASLTGVVQHHGGVVSVKPRRKAQPTPKIDSHVACKITKLTSQFARCQIVSIGEEKLSDPLRGMIRKEDVRSSDRDKVEMHKCFRPGDLAVAKVLSVGDTSCYILSTAQPELGVVVARSEHGNANMIPVSHRQMQCPVTSRKESRKVARVQPQFVEIIEK